MKKLIFISLAILIFSCKKDDESLFSENGVLKPYMSNFIPIDTLNAYKGVYYMHVAFKNLSTLESREITYYKGTHAWASLRIQSPDDSVLGIGWCLKDTVTKEQLEIAFHYNVKTDTTFKLTYANYRYANSWKNITGANIYYLKQVEGRPTAFYMYVGTNSNESFFKINYISKDRVNGTFQTVWQECCGEGSRFAASGDFSIPRIFW
jgi:hypothetical protein